jgi:putative transposase
MCRVLRVQRSGFYAWLKQPLSTRARNDERLVGLIRQFWLASGGAYGSPRIHDDFIEAGERIGRKRVERLMREHGIRALSAIKRRRYRGGKPAVVAPNRLQQQFAVQQPDRVWVTDITYIRTHEGWLYLAVVVDLYSRRVIGWSMKPTLARELALDALLMAVWRRRPKQPVIVHSDQGVQYGSEDWARFCNAHNLRVSMSRRGNCFDNAAAESFFGSLKKERVRNRIYRTREEARSDLFDYIEAFYNRTRRHSHIGGVSPCDYEHASQRA